ncbi:DJ-1/PfpI family protein [Ferrovibrio sp.]|uniref:DJ-1/PfpI family protein n=1 Tax=Ferrovibrio sp. TaxID=1917215 RepID=UPI0026168E9F|nr:DJ-1/PfpI family protein [Ferrovibrio sp.]
MALQIGFPLFPNLTQLDLTGPWEVFAKLPGADCHLLAHDLQPVRSSSAGLTLLPTTRYADCPQLDIICVPGGPGHLQAMEDAALLDFLNSQAPNCRFVTAVCTGALVLAAAGLLRGYRATTHWMSLERLAAFGAEPVAERVVRDRNRITGGGVTAGIDFGLALAALLAGETVAREIQLQIEYEPQPPYGGSPATADPATVQGLRGRLGGYAAAMAEVDARALARLNG